MREKSSQNRILWFFLALFFISIIMMGRLLLPFFSILILAAVVTRVFSPVYHFANNRFRESVSSLFTCILVFLVLFVPIVFFVSIISKEAYDLYVTAKSAAVQDQIIKLINANHLIDRINSVLSRFDISVSSEELISPISEIGKFVGLSLFEQASNIASNALKFVVNFVFMLLVIYFLLIDGSRLASFIVDLSPLPREQDEMLIGKFSDMAGAILIGNGICGIIQGVAGGVLFAVFGIKSPFLWGVIMGILAFLPIVGIGVILIPASILLLLKGKIATGVFFMIFYVFLSGGIEYLLKPKLVGDRVKMHTLLVFLAIIGGLKLFGILGIIYGPLVVTFFLTMTDIYHSSYQKMVEPAENKKYS